MKERMKKLFACVGTVGVMTVTMAVPAMADTTGENQNIDTAEVQEAVQEESFDWSDKAAANVNTYANIRQGSDIGTDRVGKLSAGAVVTVLGEERMNELLISWQDFASSVNQFIEECDN